MDASEWGSVGGVRGGYTCGSWYHAMYQVYITRYHAQVSDNVSRMYQEISGIMYQSVSERIRCRHISHNIIHISRRIEAVYQT